MEHKYSNDAKEVLILAQEQAKFFGHQAIGTEHLLLALSMVHNGGAYRIMELYGIQSFKIREAIEGYSVHGGRDDLKQNDYLPYSPKVEEILKRAQIDVQQQRLTIIETVHILQALLNTPDALALRMLRNFGVDIEKFGRDVWQEVQGGKRRVNNSQQKQKMSNTETLDEFARDLTKIAASKKLDPVIGRDKEVKRIIQILSRRTKNNPVLVGEPGVGKTAIAEGLAQKIVQNEVPSNLMTKRIMALDIGAVVAGTKYRGEFEDRFKKIIDEVYADGEVILFVDEMHTLIGAGGAEGAIDASNLIKPALARGELQMIGATTLDEYQKYIENDAAFERRFAKVLVAEPTESETIDILTGLKGQYEKHHQVNITAEAIQAAVKLSVRYINDRFLPDKAIDLIDEAAAKVRIDHPLQNDDFMALNKELAELVQRCDEALLNQNFELAAQLRQKFTMVNEKLVSKQRKKAAQKLSDTDEIGYKETVNQSDVEEVISEWTGVPVMQMEKSEQMRLINLEKVLHQRVIGQDEAVTTISRALRRARSGLKAPNRPIGSFMFLGPTGVGKTELAKTLAETMFGSENNMIRIDMSEYMEKYSSSRLVGSAPGYVGFDEGGQLTEKVRKQPYSVVLFDEVEKAHPDIFNLLLQVLDDGYLTDAKGRKISFSNTIIIMTSNLGATRLRDEKTMGFGAGKLTENYNEMASKIRESLKEYFRPEFINRLDETIVFHSLGKDEVHQIVKLMANDLIKRINEQGIQIKLTPAAIDVVASAGFDPEYGARPIRRALQTKVEDMLSESILSGEIKAADVVVVGAAKGQIKVSIKRPETV